MILVAVLIQVGYNNPSLLAAAQTPEFARALMNRPALGIAIVRTNDRKLSTERLGADFE